MITPAPHIARSLREIREYEASITRHALSRGRSIPDRVRGEYRLPTPLPAQFKKIRARRCALRKINIQCVMPGRGRVRARGARVCINAGRALNFERQKMYAHTLLFRHIYIYVYIYPDLPVSLARLHTRIYFCARNMLIVQ